MTFFTESLIQYNRISLNKAQCHQYCIEKSYDKVETQNILLAYGQAMQGLFGSAISKLKSVSKNIQTSWPFCNSFRAERID